MKEKAAQNIKHNRVQVLFGQLAAEKKKTITAVCLLTIMALMWVRVFMGKSSQNVKAGQTDEMGIDGSSMSVADANDNQPDLNITFIHLPKVKGRNDCLTRDFFAIRSTKPQSAASTATIGVSGDEKVIKKIEAQLKLEAIEMGGAP